MYLYIMIEVHDRSITHTLASYVPVHTGMYRDSVHSTSDRLFTDDSRLGLGCPCRRHNLSSLAMNWHVPLSRCHGEFVCGSPAGPETLSRMAWSRSESRCSFSTVTSLIRYHVCVRDPVSGPAAGKALAAPSCTQPEAEVTWP